MPSELYQLLFEHRSELLYVSVTAPFVNLDIAVQYINEMMAYIRTSSVGSVVFERNTPTEHTYGEYAIIGAVLCNMVPKDINFAIVDRSPSVRHIKKFFDTQYPEDCNVRAFLTTDEAEEWLRSKKTSV